MSEQAQAEIWTLPTIIEEFDHDDRICFSKLDNKYIAVQHDGTEYEFDTELRRWVSIIDGALIEQQQAGYAMPDASAESSRSQGKKRKNDHSNDREVSCTRIHRTRSFTSRRRSFHPEACIP